MIFDIYSGAGCPNCDDVKQYMQENGIKYREHNIRENEKARDWLLSKGFRSIPVVFLNGRHICGHRDHKVLLMQALNIGG